MEEYGHLRLYLKTVTAFLFKWTLSGQFDWMTVWKLMNIAEF